MIEYSDNDLVRQCLEGNTGAFEQLVNKYHKTLFNIVYRMMNNYDDAEDITQAAFVKAYEKLNTFKPKFKFFSWIYRIAVNESLNYLNQKKQFEQLDNDLVSKEKTPEEAYDEMELSKTIQNALMKLDLNYRAIVVLKHFQGCSYREIGYIMDLPEKTVKSRLFTARQLLKNVLLDKGLQGK